MSGSLRDSGEYEWDIGIESGGIFRVPITYLTGIPKRAAQPATERDHTQRAQHGQDVKGQNLKPAAV
jgi:hypothetical protein